LIGSSLIWFHGSSRSRWSVFVLIRVYTAREAGARPGEAMRAPWLRARLNQAAAAKTLFQCGPL
jgi:hypothetical protein